MLTLLLTPVALLLIIYFRKTSLFNIMSEHALAWLQDKAVGWGVIPPVNKIDTHHHCVPPFYAKGKSGCFGQSP